MLLALFHATSGSLKEAQRYAESAEATGYALGNKYLIDVALLARGLTALRDEDLDGASRNLEALLARSTSYLELYARESLALVGYRANDKEFAKEQIETSARLRRSLKIRMTAWDRGRLGELAQR